ncbi:hypothetical protein EMN47_20270 [Prolixibacteraceae bacterium JC049]|nr:hypothetical protein [Prolixibacteraceae bacterium JC049]
MNKFYVYSLIDPRTDSIFYIGKGKGKRMFQHLNEKKDVHSNTEKLKIIKEISDAGYDVSFDIIADNLTEESSLFLERILIYRIGRKIFDEGDLTNIVPGGLWHKEAPLFLKKSDLPSDKIIKEKFPELINILERYPKISKEFKGFTCPQNPLDENLYVFDNTGKRLHKWSISYFVQIFGLGHALDLINVIKNSNDPIYAWNRVWTKTNYETIESTSRIPFQDFDILNLDFTKKINEALDKTKIATLNCFYSNNVKQAEIEISHNPLEITLTYYYRNGIKKHSTSYFENKLNGKCSKWYSNGQLSEEIDYDKNKRTSRREFFDSGKIKLIENYNTEGHAIAVKNWYETGQLQFENNEDGSSFSYGETGQLLTKGVRTGDINNGGFVIISEYFENGDIKKETKNYYVDGLLHGYEKSYYDTGEIRREVDYTNGHKNKIIKTYKKNGEVKIKQ